MRSHFILALVALLEIGGMSLSTAQAGFRGYSAIERAVQERIAALDHGFDLELYLGEKPLGFSFSGHSPLVELLGMYDGRNISGTFKNGDPNVMNTLLWYLLMSGLSGDIASLCGNSPQTQLALRPAFEGALKHLCAWPAPEARRAELLQAYWLATLSFDAPWEEYEAWRDFFLGADYAQVPALRAIQDLTLAMFLNPYFLLRQ